MKKSNKAIPELTPFDWDLVGMVEGLTKRNVKVYKDGIKNQFQLYWDFDPEGNIKMHTAIVNAIQGRAAERYLSTHPGKTNITSIEFDPESWPTENRFEIGPVLEDFAFDYVSEIKALQYQKWEGNTLSKFVGGGSEIISIDKKVYTFTFPNQDGILLEVKESDYVIYKNGCFSIMSEKEFQKQYKILL